LVAALLPLMMAGVSETREGDDEGFILQLAKQM
jgi:hypothetical protein